MDNLISIDNLQQLLDKLLNIFGKSNEGYSDSTIAAIEDQLKDTMPNSSMSTFLKAQASLNNTLDVAADLPTIQKQGKTYIAELKNLISVNPTKSNNTLVSLINRVSSRLDANFTDTNDYEKREKQADELKELLTQLESEVEKNVSSIKNSSNNTNSKIIPLGEIKELAKSLKELPTSISSINESLSDLKDLCAELEGIKAKLADNDINIDPDAEADFKKEFTEATSYLQTNFQKLAKLPSKLYNGKPLITPDGRHQNFTFIKNYTEVINGDLKASLIETVKNLDELVDNVTDLLAMNNDKSAKLSKNWEELLEQAYNSENFTEAVAEVWTDYFASEWTIEGTDYRQTVAELNSVIKTEIEHFGFSEKTNPFIAFLRRALPAELNITLDTYTVIHNAFVKKYISAEALRGTDSLKDANILNNKNLYLAKPSNILLYLQQQAIVFTKFKGGDASKEFKNKALINTYGTHPALFNIALFAKEGDPTKLTKTPSISQMPNAFLKGVKQIDDILKICFSDLNTKEDIGESESDSLVTTLRTKENVISAIKYLAILFPEGQQELSKFPEVLAAGKTFAVENALKLKHLFARYNVSASNVKEVINKLATSAKLNK